MDDMQKFWENMTKPDWRVVYGEVDLSRFTPEQQEALKNGRDRGLPYQLYANKDWTISEMVDYREILAKTALAGWTQGKNPVEAVKEAYEEEATNPGYKNRFNFENHPDLVCYLPENWDEFVDGKGWTGNDFLLLCGGDAEKAARVFDGCEWQSPETVLDELEREEAEEMDSPAPEKKTGVIGPDSIRPEVTEAITARLQEIGNMIDDEQPGVRDMEENLIEFLSGVSIAIGIPADCYDGIVSFHDNMGNQILVIDRHGIVGREEAEKFIFDDELTVPDKACCLVEGYLWATEPLVTRMKEQAFIPNGQKDTVDNINFYATCDPSNKEAIILCNYSVLSDAGKEVRNGFHMEITADEVKDLISKMEAYCQKKYGVDLVVFVNNVRKDMGLPALGTPDLGSIIQNAESRKEQTPPTGTAPSRSDPTRS